MSPRERMAAALRALGLTTDAGFCSGLMWYAPTDDADVWRLIGSQNEAVRWLCDTGRAAELDRAVARLCAEVA